MIDKFTLKKALTKQLMPISRPTDQVAEPTARLLNSEVRKFLEGRDKITTKDLSNLEREVEFKARFRKLE